MSATIDPGIRSNPQWQTYQRRWGKSHICFCPTARLVPSMTIGSSAKAVKVVPQVVWDGARLAFPSFLALLLGSSSHAARIPPLVALIHAHHPTKSPNAPPKQPQYWMNAGSPPLQPGLAADPGKWLDPFAWRPPSCLSHRTGSGVLSSRDLCCSHKLLSRIADWLPRTPSYSGGSPSPFPCLPSLCHGTRWVAMRFIKDHVRVIFLPLVCR